MNAKTLIKCAKCCSRKSSVKRRLASKRANFAKQAALNKYAAAIMSVYSTKLASLDLLDQAINDPYLAYTLQNKVN